ncbi:conserved protein of unknown function [Magnetospirillum sp. XM-1]|uniref:hypothetical protein n=1 Tax=Magnetospirillum sp. XM-1 TaxID=1663591 RepID=UPI00073DD38B|nr:hypothetical protein [Magnetospirillum sp. XM-1]CUW38675.1 conserved protein of unknown function [Magnetospirillum sp. XM-1]
MSGWGCAHDDHGTCTRVAGRPCDPGMKGCVLAGRFRFSNPAKNRPVKSQGEYTTAELADEDGEPPA